MSKSLPKRKHIRHIFVQKGKKNKKVLEHRDAGQEARIFSLRYIAHFDKEKFSLSCL